jgi:hypothetical protein
MGFSFIHSATLARLYVLPCVSGSSPTRTSPLISLGSVIAIRRVDVVMAQALNQLDGGFGELVHVVAWAKKRRFILLKVFSRDQKARHNQLIIGDVIAALLLGFFLNRTFSVILREPIRTL